MEVLCCVCCTSLNLTEIGNALVDLYSPASQYVGGEREEDNWHPNDKNRHGCRQQKARGRNT
jgi:hypothetical protein